MIKEEQPDITPIYNQLEVNVLLNNLKQVVKTRLLGINDCIRLLRKSQSLNTKYKDQLALYKQARGTTNSILNRITILLDKGIFSVEEFKELKNSFIKMNLPNIKEEIKDDTFEP